MTPAPRGLLALGLWGLAAIPVSLWPLLLGPWAASGALLAAVAAVDALVLLRTRTPRVRRRVASSLALGHFTEVDLELVHEGSAPLQVEVWDHAPSELETRGLPQTLRLEPERPLHLRYRARPRERGDFRFAPADLRLRSRLGLWRRRRRSGDDSAVRVFPDFAAVAHYALLATDNRTSALGIRQRRRRGAGLEFHQLRAYETGDPPRSIDWKASARRQRVISREYQEERDQQVVFLLDCGHKLHSRDGDIAHFDHALNAVLLLAHVVVRQGDAVGVMTFAGERRWLAPRKGSGALVGLQASLYDLRTTLRPSDYLDAARELMLRVRKRSLVVIVTNLRDEDTSELLQATRLLRRRHLVLVASLRERVLDESLDVEVDSFDAALRVAGAHAYREQRVGAHLRVAREGPMLLDVLPEQLPLHLVNRYLDVKASGRL